MISLWPQQEAGISGLRAGFSRGCGGERHRSQLYVLPTGGGKTRVGAWLCNSAADKGGRAAFLVDRIALAHQTCETLAELDIAHGMLQADNTFNRDADVLVCSAQTIEKRGYFPDQLTTLVVDEAHSQREFVRNYIKHCGHAVVGLTATPFAKGLSELYTNVVSTETTNGLIEKGYLAPVTAYAAKAADMTGAKTNSRGEWAESEINDRSIPIIGDVVSSWVGKTQQHFKGPVKTIVFSASIAHGEELCRQFQAAGYNFIQVTHKTPPDECKAIIDEFKRSDSSIMGLISVEKLAKGFDVKDILCGVDARPLRKSLSSHIQALGRVMRAAEGKTEALWLCHSGNYLRFYERRETFFANGIDRLEPEGYEKQVRDDSEKREVKELKCSCGYVLKPSMTSCPSCGKERVRRSQIENVAGELVEVESKQKELAKPFLQSKQEAWQGLCRIAMDRKKGDPEKSLKFARMQYKNIFGTWPPFPFEPAEHADPRLESHVKHLVLKWAKSQRNKEAA